MLELAAHVGPYSALLICDRLAGQTIKVPMDPDRNRMSRFLSAEDIGTLARSV